MSGFEVAGVVLGSIPLVISALEHYSNGITILQRWRKYRRELDSLIRKLKLERAKLLNICEKLLDGLVPLSQFKIMITNPESDLWKDHEIQSRIRMRLPGTYDLFLETLLVVNTAIQDMAKRLDSQNGGNPSFLRRGIFVLKRSTYGDLLETIQDGITNLETLTSQNMELEPARRVRSQFNLMWLLRGVSQSLYRALNASLACDCGHDLGIKLERRSCRIRPGGDDEQIICQLAFNLTLSSHANEPTTDLAHRPWQEIVVKATGSPSAAFIIDRNSRPPRKYAVYPPASVLQSPWSLVSLRDILEQSNSTIQVLSPRDRLYLAVVISSSILQFHGTQWLPPSLSSSNIYFPQVYGFPRYSHPLFLAEHASTSAPTGGSLIPSRSGAPFAFERDPRLLSLGFLLIELMLGQTLDSLR
ncbi:hypothetical protein QBC44DRAFT_224711, partial [Cladorrhinum sp. PSN332]